MKENEKSKLPRMDKDGGASKSKGFWKGQAMEHTKERSCLAVSMNLS